MNRERAFQLWSIFVVVHLAVAVLGWVYPNQPMGDVTFVYEPWSRAVLTGGDVPGISSSWVYPHLALVPMILAQVVAAPLALFLPAASAYLVAWAVLVTALDAVAYAVLLRRPCDAQQRAAAGFWMLALFLLGPIAMYRIDAIVVPLAVLAVVWLTARPVVAGALLAAGAWIKIWPGAMLIAIALVWRDRVRVLIGFAGVSIVIVLIVVFAGGAPYLLGFLGEQGGRGLQVESVAATPFVWMAAAGAAAIVYDTDILTFQIQAPDAATVATGMTIAMVVTVIATIALGYSRGRAGADPLRLLPPLMLALITALMVTNKVGSPQFHTWLWVPILAWILWDRATVRVPAVLVLTSCVLTWFVYPIIYDRILAADVAPLQVLTIRNVIVVALFVVSLRALSRVPASPVKEF